MTGAKRDKVAIIAHDTRVWAEQILTQFPPDMAGACAIVSAVLVQNLALAGVKADIVYTFFKNGKVDFGHVYVQCNDLLIDLTATQFGSGYARVVLLDNGDVPRRWFWTAIRIRFARIDDFKIYQLSSGWPEKQWVMPYV